VEDGRLHIPRLGRYRLKGGDPRTHRIPVKVAVARSGGKDPGVERALRHGRTGGIERGGEGVRAQGWRQVRPVLSRRHGDRLQGAAVGPDRLNGITAVRGHNHGRDPRCPPPGEYPSPWKWP